MPILARSLHDLVARARGLPLPPDAQQLLASMIVCPPAPDDGGDLRVSWPEPRPLVVLHPLPAPAVPRDLARAVARAIIELNARLPVPGFGMDAQQQLTWCTILRRPPSGVALSTLRAHLELAVDMAAFGARHFAAEIARAQRQAG